MMNQRMTRTLFCFSIFILLTIALVSCVQPGSATSSDRGVQMALRVEPEPPVMGKSALIITLKDEDGAPITDAVLNVQGDMTHAGMVPVIRDVEGEAEDGLYRVPFEWSMAGDWIVTVIATLNDGTEVEQMFDLSVSSMGEGEMAGHDSMAHESDDKMMHPELMEAVKALDISGLHNIDERLNEGGAIAADDADIIHQFSTAFNAVAWLDEHHEAVATVNEALTALEAALKGDDVEAARPLATTAHDSAHNLINSVIEMGKADSGEEGHKHESGE